MRGACVCFYGRGECTAPQIFRAIRREIDTRFMINVILSIHMYWDTFQLRLQCKFGSRVRAWTRVSRMPLAAVR